MIINGCILLFPINRQPELLPQLLKSLLVDLRELPAEFDEIGPADYLRRFLRITSGFEVWQIREVGIAANVEKFCTRRSVGKPLSSHPMG